MRLLHPFRVVLLPAAIVGLVAARSFAASLPGDAGTPPARTVTIVRSNAEAKAALKEQLPSTGGRLTIMTARPCLADPCFPLRKENRLKELRVIIPSRQPLTPGSLEGIRQVLVDEGVPAAEAGKFLMDNGSISGTAEGMPVRFFPLSAVQRYPEPTVLFLDSAFFLPLYKDEVRTPMVDLVAGEIAGIMNAGSGIASVVLFDSVGQPNYPLEQGGVTYLLRLLLASPEPSARTVRERAAIRKDADLLYFFMRYPDAYGVYKKWSVLEPGDASACFRIALMAMNDLDSGMALLWLNKSAAIDPAYKRGYPELAAIAERRKAPEVAERILLAALAAFPRDPDLATTLAMFYVSRGDALSGDGATEAAADAFRNGSRVEGAAEEARRIAQKRLEELAR